MVLRQIAGPDGQPAMDIFCFAYAYNDEDESELARSRVQAHVLQPGESGYVLRLLLTSDDGAYGYFLLLGVAFRGSTSELFESADWGAGAIEVSAEVSDEMWTQAIIPISRSRSTRALIASTRSIIPRASSRPSEPFSRGPFCGPPVANLRNLRAPQKT
jgi:hypothetical protein